MTQFIAFIKKEGLELVRTGKLWLILILFSLFGIMNPAIAKLTPWLMELMSEELAESGLIIHKIEVNAMTSWTQFFKNMPIALIVFLILFSGSITSEYQKNTLLPLVTKGLKRWKILLCKFTVIIGLWFFGCLICFGITYGYNAYFWDNSIIKNLYFSVFYFFLLGLWLISTFLPASALFYSSYMVILSAGGIFLTAYLLSLFPKLRFYSPSCLAESINLLTGNCNPKDYFPAVIITFVCIILNIFVSIGIFNKKTI